MVIREPLKELPSAHLKLKENAVPQLLKPRPVPFALKEKIADELQRPEKIGVEFSDWATPIVPGT